MTSPKVAIVSDCSSQFDPANWSDIYFDYFRSMGLNANLVDLACDSWFDKLTRTSPCALLWRVWHRPDDLRDAKNKIQFIESELPILTFPNAKSLWSYDDKVRQLYIARKLGIPTPSTICTRDRNEAYRSGCLLGFPLVAKAARGACGDNVWLIEDSYALAAHLDRVFSYSGLPLSDPIIRERGTAYLQQYIPSPRDLRVITVGGKVALAFWRVGGSWKHNVSKGATIVPDGIPESALLLCMSISLSLGFPWCAFDLIEDCGAWKILEFSTQFGFSAPDQYSTFFGRWDGYVLDAQARHVAERLLAPQTGTRIHE